MRWRLICFKQTFFIILHPPLSLQSSAKVDAAGLVNFFPALAQHFCLASPAAFTQHGDHLSAELCIARLSVGRGIINYPTIRQSA